MLVCGNVPGAVSGPFAARGPRRKTSMVFDVKLVDEHVYVLVDDEDLVKSHLLLAVREEVDVLKANISKLVDKISVLERENEVLKSNASPQVLAQLESAPSLAPSPPPPVSMVASVPAVSAPVAVPVMAANAAAPAVLPAQVAVPAPQQQQMQQMQVQPPPGVGPAP